MRRTLAAIGLASLWIAAARAGDEPPAPVPATLPAAADAVAKASGDPAALTQLAAAIRIDPWLVADELCARGAFDAADAYAQAAPASRRGGVAAFVVLQRKSPTDPARRKALAAAVAASAAGRADESLRIVDAAGPPGADVVSVRLLNERALDLGRRGDPRAAAAALGELLERVRAMDWPAREAVLLEFRSRESIRLRDFDAAAADLERAADIYRGFPSAAEESVALQTLAGARYQGARYGDALAAMRRAMPLLEGTRDRAALCRAWSALALYEDVAGELAAAASHHEEALRLVDALADADERMRVALNASHTSRRMNDSKAAIALCDRALAMGDPGRPSLVRGNVLLHRATCRDDPDQALADLDAAARVFADAGARVRLGRTVGQRGEVLLRRGDADGAARSFAEALAIGEELDDPSVRSLARCGLADVADCRGDLAGAVNGFRAALADARAAGSAQAEAYCLASLADASLAAGADADALAAARESLAIQGRQVRGLGSDESRTVGDAIPAARSTGLAAARRLGDASAWFDVAETARAAALAENVGGRAAIQSSAAPPELVAESAAAQSELSRASARLAAARAAEDLAAARGAAADEAAARTRSVQSLDRLERRRKLAARLDAPAPPVLADVRRRLGPATALVEYHVGATAAEALVATADAARLVDLGPSDAVAACCADLARADGATAEALAAAAARIVGPLRLAPEVRTLVVVPDGPLATAPLAAIAGGRDVVCVPSAAIWMLLAEDGGRRGEGVLAIGDPDHAGRRLAGLPATRAEAQAVGTTVLLGRDATEAAVRKALDGGARRRAVHFACHGVADPRHPSLAGLALTAEAGDDGMLTAREVLGMAVPADLTFLSACEAGRSGARTGAAAPVLASAFLAAGSPRVVCNVWKVDDEAARAFATAFHQAFRSDGASAASALRAAREAVRADPRFAAPRHWAGWVLWGLAD